MDIRTFQETDIEQVIDLYQSCFHEPPWFETFIDSELRQYFIEMLSWPEIIFLTAKEGKKIVGVGIGFSLHRKSDIQRCIPTCRDSEVRHHLLRQQVLYMAELFVRKEFRQFGIAKKLLKARLKVGYDRGYRLAVVRTSVQQSIIINLYQRLLVDSCIIAHQPVVSKKMINGIAK